MDYLQNGITVKFFVKGEEQSSIVRLVDYEKERQYFYVVNHYISGEWITIVDRI